VALAWPLRRHLSFLWFRFAKYDGAVFRTQELAGGVLNLIGAGRQKSVEDGVDKLRLAIEQREAREQMHQSELRHHAAAAAFESGEIVRAPLGLDLRQLFGGNSLFADLSDHRVEGLQRGLAGNFRLMKNAGSHLGRAVVAEEIVDATVGF